MKQKIEPKVGDIVVITHRMMKDRYCVAKITSLTSKMFRALIWNPINDDWHETIGRRDKTAILGYLAADLTPAEGQAALNKGFTDFKLAKDAAKDDYTATVKGMIRGEVE